jgi:hypothetical protein
MSIFNKLKNLFRKAVPEYRDADKMMYSPNPVSPGIGYTLEELRNQLKIIATQCNIDEIKGVFQVDKSCGMAYFISKEKDGKLSLTNVSLSNSPEGEMYACKIMDREDFIDWAVDPWDGSVNIDIE